MPVVRFLPPSLANLNSGSCNSAFVAELGEEIEQEVHDFEEQGKEAAVRELGLDSKSVVVEALDGRGLEFRDFAVVVVE